MKLWALSRQTYSFVLRAWPCADVGYDRSIKCDRTTTQYPAADSDKVESGLIKRATVTSFISDLGISVIGVMVRWTHCGNVISRKRAELVTDCMPDSCRE